MLRQRARARLWPLLGHVQTPKCFNTSMKPLAELNLTRPRIVVKSTSACWVGKKVVREALPELMGRCRSSKFLVPRRNIFQRFRKFPIRQGVLKYWNEKLSEHCEPCINVDEFIREPDCLCDDWFGGDEEAIDLTRKTRFNAS
jgi:hypothetical protein